MQMETHESRMEGYNSLPCLAVTPLSVQPRILLAFQAAGAHCWLMSRTQLRTELLSMNSPSLYTYLGLSQPKCNTLQLALLYPIRFHSRSLWMSPLPSVISTAPIQPSAISKLTVRALIIHHLCHLQRC